MRTLNWYTRCNLILFFHKRIVIIVNFFIKFFILILISSLNYKPLNCFISVFYLFTHTQSFIHNWPVLDHFTWF